ncbi:MAG: hypothetical protein OXH08_02280 [Gammaproteobacteria bacterium]|nr:hypothetical protein [Gammaproteobacteria bacterium]MDE0650308.1 hypothetical protein [Gammaproteobacteria bacterium]
MAGRGKRAVRFPEKVTVSAPAGTRRRIEEAATADGLAPAEWHRRLIRRGIEAARKRRERKGAVRKVTA